MDLATAAIKQQLQHGVQCGLHASQGGMERKFVYRTNPVSIANFIAYKDNEYKSFYEQWGLWLGITALLVNSYCSGGKRSSTTMPLAGVHGMSRKPLNLGDISVFSALVAAVAVQPQLVFAGQ